MCWLLTRVVNALGGVRVEGRERLPQSGAVILAANHVSYLDPPLMGLVAAPRPLWYMAKAPLFRVPVLGAVMRLFRSFPVRPDAADREALRKAGEILAAGEALLIFPEGGCSDDGELQP
jgi:1-acyl-sn-glycerol-3-phosphate acyltransferase